MGKSKFLKLCRKSLKVLPQSMRFKLYRKMLRIPYGLPSNVIISVAQSSEDLEQAYRLIYDCYTEQGYMDETDIKMRANLDYLLPNTITIVAKIENKVIGTFSLLQDHPSLGLPIDKDYDTSNVRQDSMKIAEAIGLAVHSDYRSYTGQLLFSLLKYLYILSKQYLQIDCLFAAVSPQWAEFYQAIVQFKAFAGGRPVNDDLVNGSKMVGLYLPLKDLDKKLAKVFAGAAVQRNFYRFICEYKSPQLDFPKIDYFVSQHSLLNSQLVKTLLEITGQNERLSKKQKEVLVGFYGEEVIGHYPTSQPFFKDKQKESRTIVACKGLTTKNQKKWNFILMMDASKHGARIRMMSGMGQNSYNIGDVLKIKVKTSLTETATLEGRVVHQQNKRDFGVELTTADATWSKFITKLKQQNLLSQNEKLAVNY